MRSSLTRKTALALASAASLAALSACSDVNSPTAPRRLSAPDAPAADFVPTPAQVIIGGTPLGSFANYTANESIRGLDAGDEFWDNLSSDDRPLGPVGDPHSAATSHCNIGFYTTATIGPLCAFKAPNSTGVAAGIYTQYWQDAGTGEDDASAFSFNSIYTYDVTLKAAYSSGTSEIGYFYFDGTGRHFTAFPSTWADKTAVGASTAISLPAGTTRWGFYLKGTQITETPVCGTNTVCSDQDANQHFALFLNTTSGTDYLVGVEDANLHPLWPASEPTNQDSDYQDYIFTVVPRTVVEGHCTYTKGWYRNNGSSTVTAVDGRTKAEAQAIFDATPGKPNGVTWQGSNDVLNLYQQLLAALLNGGANGPQSVKDAIAAAQAGTGGTGLNITTTLTQTQVSDLIAALSAFNEGTLTGFPHCG